TLQIRRWSRPVCKLKYGLRQIYKVIFSQGGNMNLATLEKEVLNLDIHSRGRLLSLLMQSLKNESEDISPEEHEKLWAEESERRMEEMESGKVAAIPLNETLREARSLLK